MKKTAKRAKKNKNNFFLKNKRLVYVLIAILSVVLVIGVIISLNASQTNNTLSKNDAIKAAADSLKTQAIQVIHNNPASAKSLLTEARQKYQEIDDKNNMIDVDAQLYLINHPAQTK